MRAEYWLLAVAIAPAPLAAEETRSLRPGAAPATAGIAQLDWLAGTWRGEGLGGEATEIYSLPQPGRSRASSRYRRTARSHSTS